MTASAPGPRLMAQASNFSCRRRSAALDDTNTVSMPNCRKHSVSRNLEDSLRSTRATRAAAFLVEEGGARAVPKALGMGSGRFQYEGLLWRGEQEMESPPTDKRGVQKCHYLGCTAESRAG